MTRAPSVAFTRIVFSLSFVFSLGLSAAQGGTFSNLTPPDGYLVGASAINNVGQIAGGAFNLRTSELEEFIDTRGHFQFFTVPQDIRGTYITGLNDQGEAVGYYQDSNLLDHGFVRSPNGTIKYFDIPGAVQTAIQGVNNAGEFVGWYEGALVSIHGFANTGGRIKVIDANPGSYEQPDTEAMGVNNKGEIIGSTEGPYGRPGFVDIDGEIETFNLTVPGYDFKSLAVNDFYPTAINDEGEIVGWLTNAWPRSANFDLAFTTNLQDLPLAQAFNPADPYTIPFGINNQGTIILESDEGNIYTPTPEASSFWLLIEAAALCTGFGWFAGYRRLPDHPSHLQSLESPSDQQIQTAVN